jgi:hypothetical protein
MSQGVREVECSEGRAWESARGSLRVERRAPDVVLFVEKGFLEKGFAPLIVSELNASLKPGVRPEIFVDAYELDGYDSEVRVAATDWLKQNKDRVRAQHMLVRSKLGKMGLSVASLTLGGVLVGHDSRVSFDGTLDRAVRSSPQRT